MRKLFFLLIAIMVLGTSCWFNNDERVRGSGEVRTEDRTQSSFSGVNSYGSFDVYVSSGSAATVKIEADDNLLPYIETYVEGDVLKIRIKDGYWLDARRDIKVFVTAPEYNRIRSYGSGNIIGQSKITNPSKLDVGISGSADIKMEIDAPEVDADISGSGNIHLIGQTRKFSGTVSGSGDIHAMDLKSEETSVRIAGSGNADVYASVKLNVNVAGSGDVRYKGDAQVSSHIAGSGSVKKVD